MATDCAPHSACDALTSPAGRCRRPIPADTPSPVGACPCPDRQSSAPARPSSPWPLPRPWPRAAVVGVAVVAAAARAPRTPSPSRSTPTPRRVATTRCCTRRASSSSSPRCTTSLFVTQPDGTVEPSLVTEFENNADNTQTTLTLRDDVTFTDGSTLDAELVKANLDRRSDETLEAYGALAAGPGQRDHRRDRAGRADRRHHLGRAAGDAGEQPRRHRRRHRRRRRRRGPRLAGDHARRLGCVHAQRGRDDAGPAATPWTRTTRRGTPTSGPTTRSSSR